MNFDNMWRAKCRQNLLPSFFFPVTDSPANYKQNSLDKKLSRSVDT